MTADITQDTTLPIPPHFDPSKTDSVWGVDYAMIEREGGHWRARTISPRPHLTAYEWRWC